MELIDGVRVHRLPARRKRATKLRYAFEYLSFTLMALIKLTSLWLRKRHRVVYVIGIPNFIVFAAAVARVGGARVFLEMRDPLPEFFCSKYGLTAQHPLIRALIVEEKTSARFAHRVTTVVPSMAQLYTRSGVRADVIWNAPDPSVFAGASVSTPRDAADRTMLYTGSVSPHYGIDDAVRALGELAEEVPGLRLRIVTKNTKEALLDDVRALASSLGVSDRVVIEGPVPLGAIPEIIASSWIGIQPNRSDPLMDHSLSQKVLEWAQLGLPAVCGRTRALLDLFGEDDLLFHEPGDIAGLCARVREAHADPAGLERRAQRARRALDRIAYQDQIATLLRLFDDRMGTESEHGGAV